MVSGQPPQAPTSVDNIPDDVIDRLLERVVARIDRGGSGSVLETDPAIPPAYVVNTQ